MKRTTKNKQKDYKVYRKQLFETNERTAILKTSEDAAIVDQAKGRLIWQVRWMLVHLTMNTGLRVSEIAALRLQNVNINSKTPTIFVHEGKRGKSRDVYLDRELTKHLQEFIEVKRVWKQSIEPEAPLFAGQKGKPYTTTALHISFREALKAARILRKGLSIHSARHSYASLLYYKGKDLKDVQDQLGHANIAMSSLYTNIMPEERSRIANSILDDDEKPKFKRTKKPAGKFKGNKLAADLYRLKFAARELNKVLEPDPPINLTGTRDELISELREVAKLVIWESDGDFAPDNITEETKQVLNDFVNIKQ